MARAGDCGSMRFGSATGWFAAGLEAQAGAASVATMAAELRRRNNATRRSRLQPMRIPAEHRHRRHADSMRRLGRNKVG